LLSQALTAAAKAAVRSWGVIAALKRCAAQKRLRFQNQERSQKQERFQKRGLFQKQEQSQNQERSQTQERFSDVLRMKDGRGLRRAWRECGAAEIAEAAVVLPILFMFIFGILQFARLYMIYSTMQRAALEGAQLAAGSVCATCGGPPTTAASVATSMQPAFNTAHIDYSPITPPTTTPALTACTLPPPGALVPCETPAGSPNVCVQRNVVLGTATSGSPVCGASVSFIYPYGFSLPSVTTTAPYVSRQTFTFKMPVQAQVKGEN